MKALKYFPILFLISLNVLGQKNPHRIPFELKANRVFKQGKINNKKAILMYDSGASGLDVQNGFIKNKSNKITIEIGKGFKTQIVRRKYVGSMDFKKFDKNAHYHAIIGVDFFKNYIVKINYNKRELVLHKADSWISPKNGLSLQKNKNHLYLYNFYSIHTQIKICDTVLSGRFLIDTGNGRYITLLNYDNDKLKTLKAKIKKGNFLEVDMKSANLNGFNQSILTRDTKFWIKNDTLNKVPVDIADVSLQDFENNNFLGILGGGVLQEYSIFNNYRKSELILQKNKKNKNRKNVLYSDGFRIYQKGGKYFVSSIYNSNAFSFPKIRLDDRVVKVNNQPIKRIGMDSIQKLKSTLGQVISYTIERDGKIIKITSMVVDIFSIL